MFAKAVRVYPNTVALVQAQIVQKDSFSGITHINYHKKTHKMETCNTIILHVWCVLVCEDTKSLTKLTKQWLVPGLPKLFLLVYNKINQCYHVKLLRTLERCCRFNFKSPKDSTFLRDFSLVFVFWGASWADLLPPTIIFISFREQLLHFLSALHCGTLFWVYRLKMRLVCSLKSNIKLKDN